MDEHQNEWIKLVKDNPEIFVVTCFILTIIFIVSALTLTEYRSASFRHQEEMLKIEMGIKDKENGK